MGTSHQASCGTITAMTTPMTMRATTTRTSISNQPMCICWPMRRPRCWPWRRSAAAGAFGWAFLDPVVGLVGAVIILRWAYLLMKSAGATLLDAQPNVALTEAIRAEIEAMGDKVTDLHVWRVGPGHLAGHRQHCDRPSRANVDFYRAALTGVAQAVAPHHRGRGEGLEGRRRPTSCRGSGHSFSQAIVDARVFARG